MKKISFILFSLLCTLGLYSQAVKPTIMVVPSDNWCISNGYFLTFNNQGSTQKVSDYKKALQEDPYLLHAIAKVNELMAERGFPLKNLESELKALERSNDEDMLTTSKSGVELQETPLDKLKNTAKADIILQMTWNVNKIGPKKSVTFTFQGLDAYTNKQVSGASGTGEPSFSAELPVLLQEAVLSHIDNFNSQLQTHFDDLFNNGREIVVRIKSFDSFEDGLETEVDGVELNEIIENWIAEHTVQNRYNTVNATESTMLFEQVRIPLFNEKNRALDARSWTRGLQKYLRDTHNIESKLMMRGLGFAQLVVGEK